MWGSPAAYSFFLFCFFILHHSVSMQCFTITTRGTRLSLLFSLLCYAAPTFRIQSNTANQHLSSSSPLHCSHGHHRFVSLFVFPVKMKRVQKVILQIRNKLKSLLSFSHLCLCCSIAALFARVVGNSLAADARSVITQGVPE